MVQDFYIQFYMYALPVYLQGLVRFSKNMVIYANFPAYTIEHLLQLHDFLVAL